MKTAQLQLLSARGRVATNEAPPRLRPPLSEAKRRCERHDNEYTDVCAYCLHDRVLEASPPETPPGEEREIVCVDPRAVALLLGQVPANREWR